jgi:hypothetical protein
MVTKCGAVVLLFMLNSVCPSISADALNDGIAREYKRRHAFELAGEHRPFVRAGLFVLGDALVRLFPGTSEGRRVREARISPRTSENWQIREFSHSRRACGRFGVFILREGSDKARDQGSQFVDGGNVHQ